MTETSAAWCPVWCRWCVTLTVGPSMASRAWCRRSGSWPVTGSTVELTTTVTMTRRRSEAKSHNTQCNRNFAWCYVVPAFERFYKTTNLPVLLHLFYSHRLPSSNSSWTVFGNCCPSIPLASSWQVTSCWLCMTAFTCHCSPASWPTANEKDANALR